MNRKTLRNNILELIHLKIETKDLIDQIYHESGEIRLKIFAEDPISLFVETSTGFEQLSKIFKKRVITSNCDLDSDYPIKKYFIYKGIEFFCLYRGVTVPVVNTHKAKQTSKTLKVLWKIGNFFKSVIMFALSVSKLLIK
jgi:hypothetical protein